MLGLELGTDRIKFISTVWYYCTEIIKPKKENKCCINVHQLELSLCDCQTDLTNQLVNYYPNLGKIRFSSNAFSKKFAGLNSCQPKHRLADYTSKHTHCKWPSDSNVIQLSTCHMNLPDQLLEIFAEKMNCTLWGRLIVFEPLIGPCECQDVKVSRSCECYSWFHEVNEWNLAFTCDSIPARSAWNGRFLMQN